MLQGNQCVKLLTLKLNSNYFAFDVKVQLENFGYYVYI